MFKVMMKHDWHDGAELHFENLQYLANFMADAFGAFVPQDDHEELVFIIKKVKEESEDAEAVCGTEEG